jgi:hypothetical protein
VIDAVATMATSSTEVEAKRRTTSPTPITEMALTVATPMAVPSAGLIAVKGASRSNCMGPRLLTEVPTDIEPDDQAPSSGWWGPSTSLDRMVK